MEVQNPELAWASQLAAQQYRVPTTEPHYTKKDDNMMKYLYERCIVYEWMKDDKGEITGRHAVSIKYQNILDAIYTRLSHLESVSYLTSADASSSYSKWRCSLIIMKSVYESTGDVEAIELLRQLDLTVHSIYFGRAHEGTHQKYDAAVAGSRRTMTIEAGEGQRGGILGRFRK